MSSATVTGKVLNPDRSPNIGATVRAYLYPTATTAYAADLASVVSVAQTTTASDGTWSLALERTDTMTPANMVYAIAVYPVRTAGSAEANLSAVQYITVPAGGGVLEALLTVPPTAPAIGVAVVPDARYNVMKYGAKGDGTTDDTASIATAISTAPAGGTVYAPKGTYKVSGSASYLIDLNKVVSFVGDGENDTVIQIAASVGSGVDVMRIQVGADEKGRRIGGFSIVPASGTPGRYGLVIDAQSGSGGGANAGLMEIDHVTVGQFGNYALKLLNNHITPTFNEFYGANIHDCRFIGGADLSQGCGDSLEFEHNYVSGPRDLYISSLPGAVGNVVSHNNITCDGGVRLGNVSGLTFGPGNECEQQATSTNAHGALLSLEGTVSSYTAQGVLIFGNTFAPGSGHGITSPIYMDASERAFLANNTIRKGSSGHIYGDTHCLAPLIGPNAYYDNAGTTRYEELDAVIALHGVADNGNELRCLGRLSAHDATGAGAFTLFTAPDSNTAALDHIRIRQIANYNGTGKTHGATIRIGVAFGYQAWDFAEWIGSTVVNFTGKFQQFKLSAALNTVQMVCAETQLVTIGFDQGSNATAEVWDIELWGYLVKAPL